MGFDYEKLKKNEMSRDSVGASTEIFWALTLLVGVMFIFYTFHSSLEAISKQIESLHSFNEMKGLRREAIKMRKRLKNLPEGIHRKQQAKVIYKEVPKIVTIKEPVEKIIMPKYTPSEELVESKKQIEVLKTKLAISKNEVNLIKDEIEEKEATIVKMAVMEKKKLEGVYDYLTQLYGKKIQDIKKGHRERLHGLKKRMLNSNYKYNYLLEEKEHQLSSLQKKMKKVKELPGPSRAPASIAPIVKTETKWKERVVYKSIEEDRQKIIDELVLAFAKVPRSLASVNPKTGALTLNFNGVYFGYNQAELKEAMKSYLSKIMPLYTQTVFKYNGWDKLIKDIEIIGYSSPTFNKSFIDPNNLTQKGMRSLKYNMDLSFKRALSIFTYVFNDQKIKFPYQNQMLQLTKVSGRGYLEALQQGSVDQGQDNFNCGVNNCKKHQKVVLQLNFR